MERKRPRNQLTKISQAPLPEAHVLYAGNHGPAYSQGKRYVGTVDGRLIALSARNGAVAWSVNTFDATPTMPRRITGAPSKLKKAHLEKFTGAEHYSRHFTNRKVLFTDAVKYLAEQARGYWSSRRFAPGVFVALET